MTIAERIRWFNFPSAGGFILYEREYFSKPVQLVEVMPVTYSDDMKAEYDEINSRAWDVRRAHNMTRETPRVMPKKKRNIAA